MTTLHVTLDLIARADRFGARFNAARMDVLASLPGNPFDAELRPFGTGEGVACKVRHPRLRGKNRIYGFGPNDLGLLDELLAFYQADGLRPALFVSHGQMTQPLFRRLVEAGLWSAGNGTVPAILPAARSGDDAPPTPPEIRVRRSGLDEKELYLDLFQRAFSDRNEKDSEYRAFQWAEDSLPGGVRYIAEVGRKPVGMASFPIVEGVGYFGSGGVLPAYRRHGVHAALIRHRIGDAPSLGCDLILGGGSPGTTYYRNFERAGLRLVPTGSVWVEGGWYFL